MPFNASHSYSVTLDSLYTAWVKAHYPMEFYEVVLEMFSNDKDTEKVALLKNEAFKYRNIMVAPMRYGQNNTRFTANSDTNEIYQSLLSVKAINRNTAEVVYQISRERKVDGFFELYLAMKEFGLSKTHISNLSKIDYFSEIEPTKRRCLWLTNNYDSFNKKQLNKDKIDEIYKSTGLKIGLMEFYKSLQKLSIKETPKQLKFDEGVLVRYIYDLVDIKDNDTLEDLFWQCHLLGTTVNDVGEEFLLGRIVKYNPSTKKIVFKHVRTGTENWMKISCDIHVKEKDYVFINCVTSNKNKGRTYYTAESITNLSEIYK